MVTHLAAVRVQPASGEALEVSFGAVLERVGGSHSDGPLVGC